MPKFTANLGFLFTELPFAGRFEAATRAGFTAVEAGKPYELGADTVASHLRANGLSMALINAPAGADSAGGRGMACDPRRETEFRESIETALRYAEALACPRIHVLAGVTPEGIETERLYATFIENLRFAAAAGAGRGVRMLVEGINRADVPGYFLDRPSRAIQAIEDAATTNLYLQFDVYHAQMTEGNPGAAMEKAMPLIDHIQIADVPGRGPPGSGEIRFPDLFRLIDDLGYNGWIGCEYHPVGDTAGSLEWMDGLDRRGPISRSHAS